MSKKILSIDMDVIMSPSIQLYNNMAGVPWEELNSNAQISLSQLSFDELSLILDTVTDLVTKMDKKNIHFILSHEQILDFLEDGEKYTLINIDHHHDLGYQGKFDELTCGNWVWYMHQNGNLEHYVWIKNRNSDINLSDEQKEKLTLMMNANCSQTYLEDNTPDILFICLSPEFVPPQHQNWFSWMINYFNKFFDCNFKIEKRVSQPRIQEW